MTISTNKKQVKIIIVIILIIMTALMVLNNLSVKEKQIELSQKQLLQEAVAHFDSMVDTRAWNAQFGGVYVKPTQGLKPNPYLKDNTLKSHYGEQLIKINPAWMTRQISEITNKKRQYYYRITSLKPLNPDNKPDPFEQQALHYFEANKSEPYYYRLNDNEQQFDFMGKLFVEKSCLKCHAQQGYKEGDVRGGIRVTIPTKIYHQEVELIEQETNKRIIILIILSVIILSFFIWFVDVVYSRRQEKERKQLLLDMEKTINELQCIYGITDFIQKDSNIEEILDHAARLIPSGWSYPEFARARIILDDKVYTDSAFELTQWKQSSELMINKKKRGMVEVYYSKEMPEQDNGPFSLAEQFLLNNIARTLSEAIAHKQTEEKLLHLATHDPLTGFLNRNVFEQRLNNEIVRSIRYKHPLSILMLDIDHFKEVNDNLGHSAGDVVLKSFARLVAHLVRETDLIARYGGEEFVIILPETSTSTAIELAERICVKVAEHSIMLDDGETLSITISTGVANFPEHTQTRQELLELADEAMYSAKRSGRNQVKVASKKKQDNA